MTNPNDVIANYVLGKAIYCLWYGTFCFHKLPLKAAILKKLKENEMNVLMEFDGSHSLVNDHICPALIGCTVNGWFPSKRCACAAGNLTTQNLSSNQFKHSQIAYKVDLHRKIRA